MVVTWVGRVTVLGAAVAVAVMPLPAALVERWYSQQLYPAVQAVVTPLANRVPIALVDVAAGILLAVGFWRLGRRLRTQGFVRGVASAAAAVLVFAAIGYLAFLALWGLNYRRVPIEEKVDFDEARVTGAAAQQLAREAVARVNALHAPAHARGQDGPRLEAAFALAERRLGRPSATIPGTPKRSVLEHYFRLAGIDGMTVPFFLEIIVNPDVLPIERPFVVSHEWGHLAGFADEDEASLVAWMTCLNGDAQAQYSGWLAIYGHVLATLPKAERHAVAAALEAGPRRDLQAIAERYARARPAVRRVARDTYDAYLRANRVDEGIASYDGVTRLVLGAGAAHGWAPRVRLE